MSHFMGQEEESRRGSGQYRFVQRWLVMKHPSALCSEVGNVLVCQSEVGGSPLALRKTSGIWSRGPGEQAVTKQVERLTHVAEALVEAGGAISRRMFLSCCVAFSSNDPPEAETGTLGFAVRVVWAVSQVS